MKISFNADKMLQWIATYRNQNGYVNLAVTERKQPGKFGDTHCVWLDTWQPRTQQPNAPQSDPADNFPAPPAREPNDDVPF